MKWKIYKKIAKKHGVSIKEIKHEMQAAIDEAYKNPNVHAQSIHSKGEIPTLDEVVDYIVQRVNTKAL